MRYLLFFVILIFILSCRSEGISLVSFPTEFYDKCNIDSTKRNYMIVVGDNLYEAHNRSKVDSLVQAKFKNEEKIEVELYKEGWLMNRNDFGQKAEPFGKNWESYFGDYTYAFYIILDGNLSKKSLFKERKLIEYNWKKVNNDSDLQSNWEFKDVDNNDDKLSDEELDSLTGIL